MATSVSILGNSGSDVDLRYSEQGTAVAKFSIASNSFRKTAEGKEKKTDWFNVTAFGKLAERLAEHVRKGSHLLVRGSLTFNPWLTRNNEARVSADVILQDFELAGSRPEGAEDSEEIAPEEASESAEQSSSIAAGATTEPFVNQF